MSSIQSVLFRAALVFGLVGGIALSPCCARAPQFTDPRQVKVIAFGGELTGGSAGQCNPGEMDEKGVWRVDTLPVDGLTFNLSLTATGYFVGDCFRRPYTYEEMAAEIARWKALRFRNVTHNFVRLNLGSIQADWYDDKAWGVIVENLKLASRALRETGADGVMLDNEQYADQPLNYMLQAHRAEKSFDDYRAQVQKRGAEFMKALSSSCPQVRMMITYGNSAAVMAGGQTPLYAQSMGLWPAFLDGMMDANAAAEFIDGFEQAYGYRSYAQFQQARELIKEKAAVVSQDPARYRRRIKVGFGLWLHGPAANNYNLMTPDFTKNSFTPAEWQHALHYALRLSDGYIWLYAMPWAGLPKEYWEATKAARAPQVLDFQPLVRPEEHQPPAYIISAKGRPDCVDAVVFAPYVNAGDQEVYDFPKQWQFRLDPENAGVKRRWFAGSPRADWREIEIGDWWEPQIKHTYLGYAWYRCEWNVPQDWTGKKLRLAFGAVDEDAWVWLNGQKLGDHALGPDGWNSPFDLDLTGKLKPGAKNTLVVRVYNSAGVGGIWKSVKIFAAKPTAARP